MEREEAAGRVLGKGLLGVGKIAPTFSMTTWRLGWENLPLKERGTQAAREPEDLSGGDRAGMMAKGAVPGLALPAQCRRGRKSDGPDRLLGEPGTWREV